MKGKLLKKETDPSDGYELWGCPFCGAVSYRYLWSLRGEAGDMVGCEHYNGESNAEDEFFSVNAREKHE